MTSTPPRGRDLKAMFMAHDNAPFHITVYRRLRRILLRGAYRRHIASIALFVLIVFVTFKGSAHVSTSWSTNVFACPSNRANPHRIQPPIQEPHEILALSKLWSGLQKIFDAHSPSPPTLPHPKSDHAPTKEELPFLLNITHEEAQTTRFGHARVVRHLPPYPENQFNGRGIIMLAGGRYSEFAATALGMVREVGSKLPVEVWMKDDSEETPGWCAELIKEGMACRKLSDYMDLDAFTHPYQMKVFTMLFSSFEEFLFLDADDMPMKNPDVLFDSEVYRKNGAVLWPDYWKHTGSPWLPYIMGVSDDSSDMFTDEKSVESGQVMWNKQAHWKGLLLATYYNYLGPAYYYSLLNNGWAGWGDKDTFPMAMKALEEPYFQVPHDIITIFVNKNSGAPHGIGMVQADPSEEERAPFFLHSNIVKWGMREFLCLDCLGADGNRKVSHLENTDATVYAHLNEGKRIFNTNELAKHGLDPEPLLWKCMEFTACRSVWGSDAMCGRARAHMKKTFGYTFTKSRLASAVGYGDGVCVVDPVGDPLPPTPDE